MSSQQLTGTAPLKSGAARAGESTWLFSWPLLIGLFSYIFFVSRGETLLRDGDTYWHIGAGRWMFENGAVPSQDPFSHTMFGSAWTAHEWLSQIVLATAHQVGGFTMVVAVTSLAAAATVALLARALLRWMEPVYALMFAVLALCMMGGHVLARPHVLAMPVLMLWTIELVRARDEKRTPGWWLLPLMIVWANIHGGFTFGIAVAFALGFEALLEAPRDQRAATLRSWGLFLALAVVCALVTPHGAQGIVFTWQVMVEDSYALQRIGEWQSPDFHHFQPLELWLLAGIALVMHQGLRLPPVRLVLLLGLIHLSLKHMRSIELLGLLAPLFMAASFSEQWRTRRAAATAASQFDSADRLFTRLSMPAGKGALLLAVAMAVALPLWLSQARPYQLPAEVAPIEAVAAARKEGLVGPVLNSYGFGGYLILSGIPVFVDGRSDMYREALLREYGSAVELRTSESLQQTLSKHRITWTLLTPGMPAVALLDHLPGWRRVYADTFSVVHARTTP
jgi:hypothetical protein